jgi:hypothetical protein
MLTPLQKKETSLYSKLIDDAVAKLKLSTKRGQHSSNYISSSLVSNKQGDARVSRRTIWTSCSILTLMIQEPLNDMASLNTVSR